MFTIFQMPISDKTYILVYAFMNSDWNYTHFQIKKLNGEVVDQIENSNEAYFMLDANTRYFIRSTGAVENWSEWEDFITIGEGEFVEGLTSEIDDIVISEPSISVVNNILNVAKSNRRSLISQLRNSYTTAALARAAARH